MKVSVVTLGCKVNQSESDTMAELLKLARHELVEVHQAEVVILNTCAVTAKAEAESRKWLHRLKREEKRVIVTGCWADLDPSAPEREGADGLIGNAEKDRICEALEEVKRGQRVHWTSSVRGRLSLKVVPCPLSRTRAFLKVQDGCDSRCAYCVVPRLRGPSRSLDPEAIFDALKVLSEKGIKEVVLTGIHLGRWGYDLEVRRDLIWLLEEIEKRDSPPRVRLSSIEPQEVRRELIDLMASSNKLCPHLHLPLQSGSREVLEKMRRPYSPEDYQKLVLEAKERLPEMAIGADVLVGFPGEGDEDFEETLSLLEGLPLSYLHVFPFSPRPGTEAFGMSDKVKEEVKLKRAYILRQLADKKKKEFYMSMLGKPLLVLVEGKTKEGLVTGTSRNYVKCQLEMEASPGEEVLAEGQEVKGKWLLVKPSNPTTLSR